MSDIDTETELRARIENQANLIRVAPGYIATGKPEIAGLLLGNEFQPGHHPPTGIVESLREYVEQRVPPGDFLYAVLINDLREAFGRADATNRAALCEIVAYCWNHIPADCWGSRQRVNEWLHVAAPEPAAKVSEVMAKFDSLIDGLKSERGEA